MANSSILAAFQRMWEHVSMVFNAKADTDLSNVDNTTFQNKATSAGLVTQSAMEDYVGEHSGGNTDISFNDISGTLPISKGGTGATTFTSGTAIIGNGTSAFSTRNITNNTAVSDSISGSTNLITLNTLRYALNRTTSVGYADTNYTTYMARGTSLNSAETTPTVNGTIAWTYE